MNKYIPIIACALAFSGCTKTSVTTPTGSMKRTSMFQNVGIQELIIGTNGTVTLRGYGNDGGNQALTTIIDAAVAAGAKAAKP